MGSQVPSTDPSIAPSRSQVPSVAPSIAPSLSQEPSTDPSTTPSLSQVPSTDPSSTPSLSLEPSLSQKPSLSQEPSIDDIIPILCTDFEDSSDPFPSKFRSNSFSHNGGIYSLEINRKANKDMRSYEIFFGKGLYSTLDLTFYLYGVGMDPPDRLDYRQKFDTDNNFNSQIKFRWGGQDMITGLWYEKRIQISVPVDAESIQLRFQGFMNRNNEKVYLDDFCLKAITNEMPSSSPSSEPVPV